jgi:Domain of unknown function (DUF222)/HNH endonuclease
MHAQISQLSGEDLAALGEQIAEQAVHLDAAMHRLLADLRRFDEAGGWHTQGFASCAHWLSWRVGWDPATARERVRVARALIALPKVNAALAAGTLSYSKARAITRVATPKIETALLQYAEVCTASQLETICRKYQAVERRAHDGGGPQPEERWVIAPSTASGMVCVKAMLRAEEAALLMQVIQQAARQCSQVDEAPSADAPAETQMAQSRVDRAGRADGLMAVIQAYARGTSPERTPIEVIVTAPAETLRRAGAASDTDADATSDSDSDSDTVTATDSVTVADSVTDSVSDTVTVTGVDTDTDSVTVTVTVTDTDTDSVTVTDTDSDSASDHRGMAIPVAIVAAPGTGDVYLSPEATRRLACDCGLVEATVDPAGQPLSVGRKTRTIPAAIKRALLLRDRTCRFPGCDHRLYLDGHHIQHWADGGETKIDNLALLCSSHHSYVHERGYHIIKSETGELRFLDPHGHPVLAVPPRPTPPDLGWPAIRAAHADQALTADTGRCRWRGGRVDHHAAVAALFRQPPPAAAARKPPPARTDDEATADPDDDYDDYDFVASGRRTDDLERWALAQLLATGIDPLTQGPPPRFVPPV